MSNNKFILGIIFGILAIGISSSQIVFAEPGEAVPSDEISKNFGSSNSLDLLEPTQPGVTFFGNGGFSADAVGTGPDIGTVQAEVPAGSTVLQAYVYTPTYSSCPSPTSSMTLDGVQVSLSKIGQVPANPSFDLCAYRGDVTSQVAAKIGSGGGITNFDVNYSAVLNGDGVGLVVVYSNPASPEVSIAIMDGGQAVTGDNFLLGLAKPLDKNIPGFKAIMSLGIGFSASGAGNSCELSQASTVDVNGQRLTSCAGSNDDGVRSNGALITVGGVGDDTNNPPNPNGRGGEDDELYDISGFLSQGDTQINVDTRNASNDDIIFLAIIEITAQASVGEICGDKIDNDNDGSIDEGCDFVGNPRVCVNYDFDRVEEPSETRISPLTFSGMEDFSGEVHIESVEGYTAEGFSGDYLRNTSMFPAEKTTLTLKDLPAHDFVDIGFLLAIIDSWNGEEGEGSPDFMNVEVDGSSIFSTGFFNKTADTYNPPSGVLLLDRETHHRAGSNDWNDAAYDMAKEPIFQAIPHTNSTLTIDWFASGEGWGDNEDPESWAIDDLEVCTYPQDEPEPERKKNAGDNQWDKRPTFGINHEDRKDQIVENGFRFNTEQFTITDNHHTDFAEQAINVGTTNSFSATVYADKILKVQEFLFGIPTVGESHLAELGVEVWYDRVGAIEDIKVVQKSEVIDPETVSVSHDKVKCLSTSQEAKCDKTTVSMKFMEPLKDKVMAIKAIDYANRDQKTHLNEGFDIAGESLNPMLEKMIPSNVRNQGLLKVTQVEKYSPYWTSEDGRMFEMNSFGSFKQINQSFERFQDTGEPFTRQHSAFGGKLAYEQNRAVDMFDSSRLISELPDSFGYHFEIQERMNAGLKQEMLLQEEIAKGIINEMDRQDRHY